MRRIYLDHNATTPLAPEVFEAMKPYWLEDYGNASSIHWYGQRAKAAVEAARVEVARLINADPSEVVFTSGGTESDNAALFGVAEAVKPAAAHGTRHVITTSIEHHAVLHAARELERRGVEVTYVPVGSSGVVDPEDVERTLGPPDSVAVRIQYSAFTVHAMPLHLITHANETVMVFGRKVVGASSCRCPGNPVASLRVLGRRDLCCRNRRSEAQTGTRPAR